MLPRILYVMAQNLLLQTGALWSWKCCLCAFGQLWGPWSPQRQPKHARE